MSQNWVKDYLNFTYKERIALIILLSIIVIVFLLPHIIPAKEFEATREDIAAFQKIASTLRRDSLLEKADQDNFQPNYAQPSIETYSPQRKLFPFDPNTATVTQWQELGLREKTISTIQKYLHKGGKFIRPEDLLKIYGLREKEYEILKPYIRISENANVGKPMSIKDSFQKEASTLSPRTARIFTTVDLNSADTITLIDLPGIGSKLANRIIRFRDKLGGFYSIDQLKETYGLPDSTFQKIRPFLILGNKPLVRININTADVVRLQEHPYIGRAVARSLVEYRLQHGPFKAVDDILKVSSILPDQIKRLIPYLSID